MFWLDARRCIFSASALTKKKKARQSLKRAWQRSDQSVRKTDCGVTREAPIVKPNRTQPRRLTPRCAVILALIDSEAQKQKQKQSYLELGKSRARTSIADSRRWTFTFRIHNGVVGTELSRKMHRGHRSAVYTCAHPVDSDVA